MKTAIFSGPLVTLTVAAVCVAAVASLGAQAPPPPAPPPGEPLGPPGMAMGLVDGPPHETVTGVPFSATVVTEMTQTLADGNRIHQRSEGAVYRDSAGRVRHEHTLTGLGPLGIGGAGKQAPTMIAIEDPVANTHYELDPQRKSARQGPGGPHLMRRSGGAAWKGPDLRADAQDHPAPVKESLGTRTIEGVDAEGTRTTITIPAGEIGNDQPIRVVMERWYSPSLHALVLSTMSDPRFGERTMQLTNIRRDEPSADLFQVPDDYSIVQRPRGGPARR